MRTANQSEINSRISRTLLGRGKREFTQAEMFRLAELTAQFQRALEKDAAIFGAVVRTLKAPSRIARNDVELFTEFVRAIVRNELDGTN